LGGFKQSTLKTNVDGAATRYQAAAFGQFANGGNSVPYSELELYLAGLIPAGQVAPFDVFRDISAYDPVKYTWEAATRIRYDSTRILSELGARSPGTASAQKEFRLLVVVLTDKPLTDSAWTRIDKDSEWFGRGRTMVPTSTISGKPPAGGPSWKRGTYPKRSSLPTLSPRPERLAWHRFTPGSRARPST
jgi:hypothetical protein